MPPSWRLCVVSMAMVLRMPVILRIVRRVGGGRTPRCRARPGRRRILEAGSNAGGDAGGPGRCGPGSAIRIGAAGLSAASRARSGVGSARSVLVRIESIGDGGLLQCLRAGGPSGPWHARRRSTVTTAGEAGSGSRRRGRPSASAGWERGRPDPVVSTIDAMDAGPRSIRGSRSRSARTRSPADGAAQAPGRRAAPSFSSTRSTIRWSRPISPNSLMSTAVFGKAGLAAGCG